jgi:hypothetical protein
MAALSLAERQVLASEVDPNCAYFENSISLLLDCTFVLYFGAIDVTALCVYKIYI